MGCAFWRMRRHVLAKGGSMKFTKEQLEAVLEKFEGEGDKATVKTRVAFVPFICLFVGASTGLPIFLVCFACALLVIILAHRNLMKSEADMVKGVKMISIAVRGDRGLYVPLGRHQQHGRARRDERSL